MYVYWSRKFGGKSYSSTSPPRRCIIATVVYKPADYGGVSPGNAAGSLLGNFAAIEMAKQERQRQIEQTQQTMAAIQSAKSRDEAFTLVSKLPLQSPSDVKVALGMIDQIHPIRDTTPVEVKAIGPDGKQISKFLQKSQLPALNEPTGMERVFGTGSRLGTTEQQDFYTRNPDQTLTYTGKFDVSARPSGAITLPEFTAAEKVQADKAAAKREDANATRLDLNIQASERAAEAATRSGNMQAATLRHQQLTEEIQSIKAANNLLKDRINVKKSINADGSITLDFQGDTKKIKAYNKASDILPDMMQRHGNPNKAVTAAMNAAGLNEEEPSPPAPAAKEPGFFEKATQYVKSLDKTKQQPKKPAAPVAPAKPVPAVYEKMSTADRQASIENAKAAIKKNPVAKDRIAQRLIDAGFPFQELSALLK